MERKYLKEDMERKYLREDTAQNLVHACVIQHIEYCNSLLYGLPIV
jgi:hypothetical protein